MTVLSIDSLKCFWETFYYFKYINFLSGGYDPLNLFSAGAAPLFPSKENTLAEEQLDTSPTDSDSGQSTPAMDGLCLSFRITLWLL